MSTDIITFYSDDIMMIYDDIKSTFSELNTHFSLELIEP